MMKALWLSVACIAAPVAAQPPGVGQASAAAAAPVDPARLALSRTTIDYVWPLGTYARMMKGTMDQMMDGMMQSMFDMRLQDMAPAAGAQAKDADPELARLTLREMMEKQDPHFQERMQITNRVMMAELIPVMSKVEPDIREGLAIAYARKFTAAQLADMNAFFATPSGRAYAAESLLTMTDPEVMKRMVRFMPEMIAAMPAMMEKVKQATAHLPPPKVEVHPARAH